MNRDDMRKVGELAAKPSLTFPELELLLVGSEMSLAYLSGRGPSPETERTIQFLTGEVSLLRKRLGERYVSEG